MAYGRIFRAALGAAVIAALGVGCGDDDATPIDAGGGDGSTADAGPGDGGVDAAPVDAPIDAGIGCPEPGAVYITELISNPVFDPAGARNDDGFFEFLEIHNPGTEDIDLLGWTVADRASRIGDPTAEHVIATSVIVPAGGFVTLAANADPGFEEDYSYDDAFGLSGGGEDPSIGCGGTIIDTVDYEAAGFPPLAVAGRSLSLAPAAHGADGATQNDDGANWCYNLADVFTTDGAFDNYGTPGVMNPACPTPVTPATAGDVVIAEVMHAVLGGADTDGEWIEVCNPTETTLFDLDTCGVSDDAAELPGTPDHTIAGEVLVFPGACATLAATDLPPMLGFVPTHSYGGALSLADTGAAPGIACGGTVIDAVDATAAGFPTPVAGRSLRLRSGSLDATANDDGANWCLGIQPYRSTTGGTDRGSPGEMNPAWACEETPDAAGEVVITEIQAAPIGYAGADELAEWLEVHNPDAAVPYNLRGCLINDKSTDTLDQWHEIAADVFVVPGGFATLASNGDDAVIGFAPDYDHMDAFGLSGAGEDPAIHCGTVIDVVDYATFGAGMLPDDMEGAALSLDPGSYDATANDTAANWCFATDVFHTADGMDNLGTPGEDNPGCP